MSDICEHCNQPTTTFLEILFREKLDVQATKIEELEKILEHSPHPADMDAKQFEINVLEAKLKRVREILKPTTTWAIIQPNLYDKIKEALREIEEDGKL